MRNIIKITIAFVLLLTIGCSKELLDPVPQTSLSDLSVFDTKDRVIAQVNGMYDRMKAGAYLGGRYFVYHDIRADNFIPKSSNLVTNFASWNHTEVSSTNEVQNLWGAIYAAVNSINVFYDGLVAAWDGGVLEGKINQAEFDQFKSEALALRAICYFDLLQLYTKPYNQGSGANPGVPLRLLAERSAEGNDLARSTVAEVYAQILKDLNDAEPLAKADYANDLLNTTRIHKNTIIAYKTRVYLHMQDWAKVVSESAKIVSSAAPFTAPSGVAFTLNSSFVKIFETPYTSKESIFSMPMTDTDGPGTQNGLPHYYSFSSSESYYLNTTTGSVYDTLDATDVRKTSLLLSDGKYFLTKFPDYTTLTNYCPVLRYAEVLLKPCRGNRSIRECSYPGSSRPSQCCQDPFISHRSLHSCKLCSGFRFLFGNPSREKYGIPWRRYTHIGSYEIKPALPGQRWWEYGCCSRNCIVQYWLYLANSGK